MTELKTLKDFKDLGIVNSPCSTEFKNGSNITLDLLKQEAIKWIKAHQKNMEEHKNHHEVDEDNFPIKQNCGYWVEVDDPYYSYCNAKSQLGFLIKWIKQFFNITEEDLK